MKSFSTKGKNICSSHTKFKFISLSFDKSIYNRHDPFCSMVDDDDDEQNIRKIFAILSNELFKDLFKLISNKQLKFCNKNSIKYLQEM